MKNFDIIKDDVMVGIENIFRYAYNHGYSDGCDVKDNSRESINLARSIGRQESWKCAKRVLFDSSLPKEILRKFPKADTWAGLVKYYSVEDVLSAFREEVSLDWWKKQSNSDEDCISRAKLKEYISKDESTDFFKGWNRAIDAIYTTAPSIQPKTDVLDKIIAEIKTKYDSMSQDYNYDYGWIDALEWVASVIGKYKAESEDKK